MEIDQRYTLRQDLVEMAKTAKKSAIPVFEGDAQKVILFKFDAGEGLTEHQSGQPVSLYFIQGEAEVRLGTDRHIVQGNSWIQIEPNLLHSVVAKTPLIMLLQINKCS